MVSDEKSDIKVALAELKDVTDIHEVLKQNLIEMNDFENFSKEQKVQFENRGFLRKEVEKEYYENLIKNPHSRIYVARNKNGKIVGFASFLEKHYNIWDFRETLTNLYAEEGPSKDLLTNKTSEFIYFDQISIIPEYQGRGIGTLLIQKALKETSLPIVSFVVKKPLANLASAKWHETNRFEMVANCDGKYKDHSLEWWIYIHWNEKNT